MDIPQLAQQFHEQGFLYLQEFFEPGLMQRLQDAALAHYGANPAFSHSDEFLERAATEVIPWFPQWEGESVYDEVDASERLQALTTAILGQGWRNLYCMAMYSHAWSKGQAWHQDCPPENPRCFNLNRLVYTMAITAETGGELVLKPGSHRLGALSRGDPQENFPDQLVLRPAVGDLALIHGHTWHRVLPVKGRYRISTNYRAVPSGTAEDITDIAVYRNMRYQFSSESVLPVPG